MQKIIPNLRYNGDAAQAVDFYLSVFADSKIIEIDYYPTEWLLAFQQHMAGQVLTIEFEILGQRFLAINAGPEFKFNESVSFLVLCKDQSEIDYYREKLTSNWGEESVCGWCKDKYGLSRQINPENMSQLMKQPQSYHKLMNMKKIIIREF